MTRWPIGCGAKVAGSAPMVVWVRWTSLAGPWCISAPGVQASHALSSWAGAGVFCYLAVIVKSRLGYDDSLDAFGVHGIGGTWGALATGLFASKAINSGGADGLFFGNPGQLWLQFIAVLAAWALAFIGTFVILKIVDWTMGLRVANEDEQLGLDLSQHEERAYSKG